MMIGNIKSAPDVDVFEGGFAGADADEASRPCIVMTESDMASSNMLVSGECPESVSVN